MDATVYQLNGEETDQLVKANDLVTPARSAVADVGCVQMLPVLGRVACVVRYSLCRGNSYANATLQRCAFYRGKPNKSPIAQC
jgi:hypothetical protein